MKLDLHIHTHYSKCSNLNPSQAIQLAEKAGLDAIALVNHDLKPQKYESKQVKVIPGVEVSTKQGHLLIINTLKEFKAGEDAQEVINQASKDALIIIPHAFDITRHGMGKHIKKLKGYHAIELNARCLFNKFNNKARAYAETYDKPLVGGSDSHFKEEIGNAYTSVNASSVSEAIQKIKQGKTKTYIKKRRILNKLGPYTKSMIPRKKIKN